MKISGKQNDANSVKKSSHHIFYELHNSKSPIDSFQEGRSASEVMISKWDNNIMWKDILDKYFAQNINRKLEVLLKQAVDKLMKKIQEAVQFFEEKQKFFQEKCKQIIKREKWTIHETQKANNSSTIAKEGNGVHENASKNVQKMMEHFRQSQKGEIEKKVKIQEQDKTNILIKSNKIKVEKYNDWTQVKLNETISKIAPFRFVTHIVETKNCSIMVGIARKSAEDKYLWNSAKAICYFGRDGNIWYGEGGQAKFQNSGKGFQKNDIIVTEVNMMEGTIKWFVNGIKAAERNLGRLKNEDCVPFWDLKDRYDTIQWMVQQ